MGVWRWMHTRSYIIESNLKKLVSIARYENGVLYLRNAMRFLTCGDAWTLHPHPPTHDPSCSSQTKETRSCRHLDGSHQQLSVGVSFSRYTFWPARDLHRHISPTIATYDRLPCSTRPRLRFSKNMPVSPSNSGTESFIPYTRSKGPRPREEMRLRVHSHRTR
jgi:hypothetical protein